MTVCIWHGYWPGGLLWTWTGRLVWTGGSGNEMGVLDTIEWCLVPGFFDGFRCFHQRDRSGCRLEM